MYLMSRSRPDLAYAIRKPSQYLQSFLQNHRIAVIRELRYISSTRYHGILSQKIKNLKVRCYCDSDWAGCRETRKSTSTFAFIFEGEAISWRSKKLTIVARSAYEAEYIAASLACKEAICMSRFLADMLSHDELRCTELRYNNSGAITKANIAVINQQHKHID